MINPNLKRLALILFLPTVQSVCHAATLTVTHTSDAGPGSLRQAILDSNSSVGVFDTIAFDIPTQPGGAVSRYPAELDANDAVDGNDGALLGNVTFATGAIGKAFDFDASAGTRVEIPDAANLQPQTLSVTAWVNARSVGANVPALEVGPIIVVKDLSLNRISYAITGPGSTGKFSFQVGLTNGTTATVFSANSFGFNTYYHVAMTWDGTVLRGYVDGALEGELLVGPTTIAYASTSLTIGSHSTINGELRRFDGQIDEVEIYDSAFSPSEVQSLFLIGSALQQTLSSGLVSLYRAEGAANDSGDGNHGALMNGATFAPGVQGQAFSLDGVDDYISVPHNDNLNPTGPFSVAAWIKAATQQLSSDGQFLIVDKSHGWTDGSGWALQGHPDGKVAFFFGFGGNAGDFHGVSTVVSLLDDEWHHLAGVYTDSVFEIWLDGALNNSASIPGAYAGNTRDVEIGRSWGGGSPRRFFHGSIDELSFHNRALAATEVVALRNAGVVSQSVGSTMTPLSPLPGITDPVNIDGYTQPGAARNTNATGAINAVIKIELDGSNAGASNGLTISAGGSTVQGLAINRFTQQGIHLQGAGGNFIEGCFIGTDATGSQAHQNGFSGAYMDSPNNTIGGTTPSSRNLISGNFYHGVEISGAGATGNRVQGNLIGTDAAGTGSLPGTDTFGVFILEGASDIVIGGVAPGVGNVISGNASHGIEIRNSSAVRIEGNFIGTDASGTAALGNGARGVNVSDSSGCIIGGTVPGARNVISGNLNSGVRILNPGSTGNLLQGNYIGVDVHGAVDLGNSSDGLLINNADGNTIGGTAAGAGNLISGNEDDGLELRDSFDNIVEGNRIGSDASGAILIGNLRSGVFFNQSSSNRIGGAEPGAGNLIVGNGEAGIMLRDVSADNPFLMNSIHSNTGLGIDLGEDGVTPNDIPPGSSPPDQDSGPNNLQNFPTLTSIGVSTLKSGEPIIQGNLQSVPGASYRIEFFAGAECDPSGNGEGSRFLGFTEVSTDSTGSASIDAVLNEFLSNGEFVTATATTMEGPSDFGDTSEFSECLEVAGGCAPPFPDFVVSGRVDGADLLLLFTGLRLEEIDFDLNCDQIISGDDLFRFSLDWYDPHPNKER